MRTAKTGLIWWTAAVVVAAIAVAVARAQEATPQPEDELARRVSRLVRQLDDDSAARREAAEKELFDAAGTTADSVDKFLAVLPKESEQMPLAVRERLARIRSGVEDRAAKAVLTESRVTLDVKSIPILEAFAAIEKQTGNRAVDHRQLPPELASQTKVMATFQDEPYWSAVDTLLDQASLGVYTYAGEGALAIVEREQGDGSRSGSAVYSGPFRVEALEIQAQRNLRKADRSSLRVQLEVAWEPRLRPIAVSQSAGDVTAVDDAGATLEPSDVDAVLGAEIPNGTQATELILPFKLPPRSVLKIASLKGKLRALVPGRQVKFEFADILKQAGQSQRRGGVEVAVDAVRKNNEIWEIHMRLRLDEDNHALESHRGWAFQNLSYLADAKGETIDNAGLETTMQSENEVGVAYFFDREEGLDGLAWVYETPAAIVELPVEYELKDLALP
jgi:hypothetical protein